MRLYTSSAQGNSQSNLDHLENSSIGSLSLEYCGVQTPESSPHGSPFNSNPMINDSVLRSTCIIEQYRCGSANLGDANNVPQNGLVNGQQSVTTGVTNAGEICDSNRPPIPANLTGYSVDNYKSSLAAENGLQNNSLNNGNNSSANGDMENHASNYVALSSLSSSSNLLDPAGSLPTPEMSPVENNDKVSEQGNLHHPYNHHPYHRVPAGSANGPGGGAAAGRGGNDALLVNRQLYRLIQSNPRTSTVDSQGNQTTVYS